MSSHHADETREYHLTSGQTPGADPLRRSGQLSAVCQQATSGRADMAEMKRSPGVSPKLLLYGQSASIQPEHVFLNK